MPLDAPIPTAPPTAPEAQAADVTTLAWIEAEVRRIWEGTLKALRRVQREGAQGDALLTPLVQARAALHQASGALTMVGLPAAERVQTACERAVQQWLIQPQQFTPAALQALEHAGHALQDELRLRVAGQPVPALALYPAYAQMAPLAGLAAEHPAQWVDGLIGAPVPGPWAGTSAPLAAGPATRQAVEGALLAGLRGQSDALHTLSGLFSGLGAGAGDPEHAEAWHLAAALFQAQAGGVWAPDEHGRRIGSRLLALLRGKPADLPALRRDLRFFAAGISASDRTPLLAAAQQRLALPQVNPQHYHASPLGRVDPALRPQAAKRLATLRETWAAITGGDRALVSALPDQTAQLAPLLTQVLPHAPTLGQALAQAVTSATRAGAPPPDTALEIATALLCVDAALAADDGDLHSAERLTRLGERLTRLTSGEAPGAIEPWMEQLFRDASERQTIGNVVQELRSALAEVEALLDRAHRDPTARSQLVPAPGRLADMRGVFSVLGLAPAAQAVLRLRDDVERWIIGSIEPPVAARIAHNVSALGFLIDMLAVQPQLTKSLFQFDAERGELASVLTRATDHPPAASTAPATTPQDAELAELREVFFGEADEVLDAAQAALAHLDASPLDAGAFTALRRALHTLKGSARMVQLTALGEAAWAGEQVCNRHLAAEPPFASAALRSFAALVLDELGEGVTAAQQQRPWQPNAVVAAAQPLLETPKAAPAPEAQAAPGVPVAEPDLVLPGLPQVLEGPDALEAPPLAGATTLVDVPVDAPDAALDAPMPAPDADDATIDLDFGEPLASDAPAPADGEFAATLVAPMLDLSDATAPALPVQEQEQQGSQHSEAQSAQDAGLHEPDDAVDLALEFSDAAAPELPTARSDDDRFKHIGPLRVPIDLFNIYLAEADERSRLLATRLAEWGADPSAAHAAACVEESGALAHALAGDSATVGYHPLADLARWLERAVRRMRSHGDAPGGASVADLVQVADEARRLLHQFAAGLWREVPPALTERLAAFDAAWAAAGAVATSAVAPLVADDAAPPSDAASVAPAAPAAAAEPPTAPTTPASLALAALSQPPTQADQPDAMLWPVFAEEAQELLPALSDALHTWEQAADQPAAPQAALRTLHTFKGSARLAGALALGDAAHRLEAAIEHLASAPEALTPPAWTALHHSADALAEQVQHLSREASGGAPAPEAPAAREAAPRAVLLAAPPTPAAATARAALPTSGGVHTEIAPGALVPAAGSDEGDGYDAPVARIRVQAPVLDRLLTQAAETTLARARLETEMGRMREGLQELGLQLDRLRSQARELEMQAETQMASRASTNNAAQDEFDPLEMDRFTRVQELTRMLAETVSDVGAVQRGLHQTVLHSEEQLAQQNRLLRAIQDEVLGARLVAFATVAERMQRVVRRAARECDKHVLLTLDGADTDIDRLLLDRMTPVLEHLLRNAVAHGIEAADERRAAGKPGNGDITLALRHGDNAVQLAVRDDGRGLNAAAIAARARAMGWLAEDAQPSAQELAQFIFRSGLSTADSVTQLAGRGVGLDVVHTEVSALGGHIGVDTEAGQGTTITVTLPLTSAISQVLVLRAGNLTLALPAPSVQQILQPDAPELAQVQPGGHLVVDGVALPCLSLARLLGLPETAGEGSAWVLARDGEQGVLLLADAVQGQEDVVVRRVGPQLARLPALAGVALRASGEPLLIYHPLRLRALAEQAPPPLAAAPSAADAPLVLVVDDSLTVRRVTERLLQREGLRVALARDGEEALQAAQRELPALVLSDIEMPRMDGFELLRRLKAEPDLAAVPVVMITSRIAERHREHALQLGAADYLGKPFDETRLKELIAQLVA